MMRKSTAFDDEYGPGGAGLSMVEMEHAHGEGSGEGAMMSSAAGEILKFGATGGATMSVSGVAMSGGGGAMSSSKVVM